MQLYQLRDTLSGCLGYGLVEMECLSSNLNTYPQTEEITEYIPLTKGLK